MTADLSHLSDLEQLRREIHRFPELSGKERETKERVRKYIEQFNPDEIIELADTGLAAVFNGKKAGPVVHFRSELDALPIEEENDFSYRSEHEGVSHKCGHDGHTAVVAGLAKLYADKRPESGKAVLLFQPAEEDGRGAEAILNDEKFESIEPDYVFAFHNLPGFPVRQIIVKEGTFTAAAKSLIIKLKGKTSHAAEPEKGANPAYAISEILEKSKSVMQTDPGKDDFSLITPVYIKVGEIAYGVSAGKGDLRLTLRAFSNDVMDKLTGELTAIIKSVSESHKIKVKISTTEVFSANVNDAESVDYIRNSARENDLDIEEIHQPFKWGEDYGSFTDKFPGAMFGIGSGKDHPALHNPDYDFPDELIETGVKMFYGIGKQILK